MKESSAGNTLFHPIQRSRQRRNQPFEGLEVCDYPFDPRTGWRSYPLKSQGNLRHPHLELNSSDFLVQRCFFACRKYKFSGNRRRGVDRYTCRTPHFHMHSHCTVQTPCAPWLMGPKGSRRIVSQNRSFIHASCFTVRLTEH